MTFLINFHTFGGSQSEAADPQHVVAVATAAEADEVEAGWLRHLTTLPPRSYVRQETDIRTTEVPETLSATDALASLISEATEVYGDDDE